GLLEIRPAEFRLDGCISREAFALATAAVAPATAPSAATAAALALAVRLRRLFEATHCGGLMRLLRPANIVFASCGSEVRGSLLREFLALLLERLFAATAAAPPAPAPAAWTMLARRLHLLFRRAGLGIFGIGPFLVLVVLFLLLLDRDSARRLQRQRLCLLQAVHLLAFLDDEGQLSRDGSIGIDHDGDAEALLERAQMRAFVIEQIKRDIGTGANRQIMRCSLEKHFLERAQELQRHGGHRTHVAGAAAMRAFLGRALEHTRANALARHFEQAEMRDVPDLDASTVVPQAFLQPPLDGAVVTLLVHIDEIDDD